MDKFGGIVAIILALASLGITLSRFANGAKTTDILLALMFAAEVAGAAAILPSKRAAMSAAFWILTFRVIAGVLYLGAIHNDKLARDTLGFPVVEAIYCWVRVRALKVKP
jgi:hypothetical protein